MSKYINDDNREAVMKHIDYIIDNQIEIKRLWQNYHDTKTEDAQTKVNRMQAEQRGALNRLVILAGY